MVRISNIIVMLVLGLLVIVGNMIAQGTVSAVYTVGTGSQIWIEGSSSVNTFSCESREVRGMAWLYTTQEDLREDRSDLTIPRGRVEVSLSTQSLDCGHSAMNGDLYQAMKADSYPTIEYHLLEAKLPSALASPNHTFEVNTTGLLTIAGRTDTIEMVARIERLDDGTFRVTSKKRLSMRSFDITPPTAFFGLIRANDALTVHFDLIVTRIPIARRGD